MNAHTTFRRLDEISRQRALTPKESIQLQQAIREIDRKVPRGRVGAMA